VQKILRNLCQPEPRLSSDYDHSILKSHNAAKRSRSSSGSGKSVPQLGEQENVCPCSKCFLRSSMIQRS
jgi:hypothetical protein